MTILDPPPSRRPAASHLDIQISYRLGVPLIYVKGELDHDSTASLREVAREETQDAPLALLLDFTDLSFMDSGGLSLMFELIGRFSSPRWLGVIGANAGVKRLFEITGMADREGFRLFPDMRTAARALEPGSPG